MTWQKQLIATGCALLVLTCTGCRTGKIGGMNLFGFKSEPSAEHLAGSGPTVTYPVPPSESATPEAIASIAGGTVAPGPSLSPGIRPETPAINGGAPDSAPSYVASAGSNGSFGSNTQINAQPVGFRTPSLPKPTSQPMEIPAISTPSVTMPEMPAASGYQFGSNSAASSPASAYTAPIQNAAVQVNQFANNVNQFADNVSKQASGMTLPDSLPTNISAPAVQVQVGDMTATMPSASLGSSYSAPTSTFAPASTFPPPPPTPASSAPPSTFGGGYSPGSTSGSGYPAN